MKRLILGLAAVATLAVAAPAFAHDDDDDDWNIDSYASFNHEYRHIWDGIQHGLSDGSFSPYQAQRYYRALQSIRARANWEERTGRFDPDDIQARLESLHTQMHIAHERGHERMDDWNNSRYGYSGYYGYYGYSPYSPYRR